jgi:hypothetical protein
LKFESIEIEGNQNQDSELAGMNYQDLNGLVCADKMVNMMKRSYSTNKRKKFIELFPIMIEYWF